MSTAKDFSIGERVVHVNHGLGNIYGFDDFDDSAIFVDFDIQPESWDKVLDVSVNCLKKVDTASSYKIWDVIKMCYENPDLKFEDDKNIWLVGYYMGVIKSAKQNGGYFSSIFLDEKIINARWTLVE